MRGRNPTHTGHQRRALRMAVTVAALGVLLVMPALFTVPWPSLLRLGTAIVRAESTSASAMPTSMPTFPPRPDIATHGVTLAGRRGLRVNGEPFVPIFSWWVDVTHLKKLAATGINTSLSPRTDVAYADAAAAQGLYVGDDPPGTDPRGELTGHPRHLMWMQDDEPDIRIEGGPRLLMGENHVPAQAHGSEPADALIQRVMPKLRDVEQRCRDFGDRRPVFLNFSYLFLERFWGPDAISRPLYVAMCETADVVSWDIYPIAVAGRADWLPLVYEGTARLRSFVPDKPVFMFIECTRTREGFGARDPSEAEMRNEAWQAIAAGATGIGYFTFGPETAESNFARRSFMVREENQRAMARINAEIQAHTALITAEELASAVRIGNDGMPQVAVSVRVEGEQVQTGARAILVNCRAEPQPVGWPAGLSVRQHADPARIAAAADRLKLASQPALEPLEVRILGE